MKCLIELEEHDLASIIRWLKYSKVFLDRLGVSEGYHQVSVLIEKLQKKNKLGKEWYPFDTTKDDLLKSARTFEKWRKENET